MYAESAADRTEIFSSYDQQQGILYTDQGSYQVAENTLVTKNGYLVTPGDLVEGEELTLSPLLDSALGKPLLAVVAAQTKPGAVIPKLEVAAPWRGGVYVSLSCFTTADRLYIYLPDGERQSVPVVKGRNFLYSFQPAALPAAAGTGQQGLVLQLVAFDNATGGVTGQTVAVPAAGIGVLGDLDGSWAAAAVKDLLAQNLITGYPDGTYRPEQPITRAEFAVLLSKALGWSGSGSPLSVEDAQEIPAWAKPAVGYCLQHGLFQVGEDGSFHPDQPLTRAEAAVVLDKALQVFDPGVEKQAVLQPGWQDWLQIPSWAQLSAARVFTAGIMSGVTSGEFSPNALLKRGEAAVVIDRLLEELRQVH